MYGLNHMALLRSANILEVGGYKHHAPNGAFSIDCLTLAQLTQWLIDSSTINCLVAQLTARQLTA